MNEIKSIRIPPIHTGRGGVCDVTPPQNRSRELPLHSHRYAQLEAVGLCNTPPYSGKIESSSIHHLHHPLLRADAGTQSHSAGPSQHQLRTAGTRPFPHRKRKRSHPRTPSRTPYPSLGFPLPCLLAGPPDQRSGSFRTAATGRTSMHDSNHTARPLRTVRSQWWSAHPACPSGSTWWPAGYYRKGRTALGTARTDERSRA